MCRYVPCSDNAQGREVMESGRRLTGHADKLCATLVKTCVVIATDKELWETVRLSAADCVYLAGCVQVRKGGGGGVDAYLL